MNETMVIIYGVLIVILAGVCWAQGDMIRELCDDLYRDDEDGADGEA